MQTLQIDLGGLDLESKDAGLRLQLSSQARFAPSAEDDIDALRERLNICQLTTHSLEWPWITRGSDFKLEILLQMEDLRREQDREDLVDILTTQLRTAKLWYQLGVTPTSIETSIPQEGAHLVIVYLAYDQKGTQTSLGHKLVDQLMPGSVQPPEGSSIAFLDSVCLEMHVERSRGSKRRRLQRRCSDPGMRGHSVEGLTTQATPSENLTDEEFRKEEEASLNPEERATTRSLSTADLLLKTGDLENTYDDDFMLLSSDYDDKIDSHQRLTTSPSPLKRNSTASNLDIEHSLVGANTIVDLVDAAMRMAILDCRKDLKKGIQLTSTHSIQHLSQVAPALWSPGYLSVVNSRGILVPTISHALESVYGRIRGSRKLGEYARSHDDARIDALDAEEKGFASAWSSKQFESRLWQALRRGAYSSSRGKRLRSLAPSVRLETADVEKFDEILDSDQSSLKCRIFGDREEYEDEDENLLLVDDDSLLDKDEEFLLGEELDYQADEFHEEVSDDDMLSSCETLDSLAISEGDVEESDGFRFQEDHFETQEMLCI